VNASEVEGGPRNRLVGEYIASGTQRWVLLTGVTSLLMRDERRRGIVITCSFVAMVCLLIILSISTVIIKAIHRENVVELKSCYRG
jgi:hypothetical protein